MERKYKWGITPHPYDPLRYDVYITDNDQDALKAILDLAESYLWDSAVEGETRKISVRLNKVEEE